MLITAFRNLFRARLRTFLTLAGVGASLSVYVVIASMSHGYKKQLDHTLTSSGVEIIVQARKAATPLGSRISAPQAAKIASLPGIASVTPVMVGAIKTPNFPYTILVGFEGVKKEDAVGRWLDGSVISGRLAEPGRREITLGQLAAKRSKLWVGDRVKFDEKSDAEITGVITTGLDLLDGAVLTDRALATDVLGQTSDYNMLLVKVERGTVAAGVMKAINDSDGFLSAFPANKLAERLRNLMLVDNFIVATGAASFALACLLVLNTLVLSVSERTREIGILMAIGWSRARITAVIMAEAVILCLAGGVVGFALSWVEMPLLAYVPGVGVGWVPLVPEWSVIPQTFLLSAAVGCVSSLFPALYSTSLRPVEALRRD